MAKNAEVELSCTAAPRRSGSHGIVSWIARLEACARREGGNARGAKASVERVVDVVRDTRGIQAQVMSAAERALWTGRRETTRDEIGAALFDRREFVTTSARRLTLHLIPATDPARRRLVSDEGQRVRLGVDCPAASLPPFGRASSAKPSPVAGFLGVRCVARFSSG